MSDKDKATLRISGNARRKEILGFPKGPQPLGTLTLLARSSVLYLCEGDGVDRNACALIQLADAQLSIPAAKGYPLFARSFSLFLPVIKCLSTHIVRAVSYTHLDVYKRQVQHRKVWR